MSLQFKILSFVLALGLASAVLTISIFSRAMDMTLTAQVIQIARSEAEDLAPKVLTGIENRDENQMLRELQSSLKVTGAHHIMVIDNAGLVLAHTNVNETGKRYDDPVYKEIIAAGDLHVVREGGGSPIVLVSAPIWNRADGKTSEELLFTGESSSEGQERVGSVVISIPLEHTIFTRTRMIHQLMGIAGLIGLIGLATSAWIIKGIMKPVRLLTEGTAQISKGEYGVQIPVSRNDELGELADDFNRMSRILSQTTISKDFMTSVFAHMTEPLMVFGNDGRMRMVNSATLRLLGYEEAELIGQPVAALLPVPVADAEPVSLKPVNDVDFELLAKNGTLIPVVYSCSTLKDGTGAMSGSIMIARDMTERQRLETAMRRSEKMSAVGQLAAGVAHEINNPLGVILGYAQAIVRRLPPADPMEAPLKSIEKEAVRCKNLVQDLLTFSRVSKVEKEPMDLNKTVTAAMSLVSAQAKIGQVTVEKSLAEGLPHIFGNTNQVQQVIINLATNALDAMGQSGTLLIATEALQEGPLSWVCLKVTDTGTGIPAEVLSRIFEPFFTTKAVGKGTGLGLSLVHEIIKKHSGSIDVNSRPGRTEFRVKFPVRNPAHLAAPLGGL